MLSLCEYPTEYHYHYLYYNMLKYWEVIIYIDMQHVIIFGWIQILLLRVVPNCVLMSLFRVPLMAKGSLEALRLG